MKRKCRWKQPEVTICFSIRLATIWREYSSLGKVGVWRSLHSLPLQVGVSIGMIFLEGNLGCGEACTLFHYWWECHLAWFFWKAIWQYVSKATSFDIVFLLLGICLKGLIWQVLIYTRMFNLVLFIKAQDWKKLNYPSMKNWLNQLWKTEHVELYLWILKFYSWFLIGWENKTK